MKKRAFKGKAVIVLGARQTGKTTLIQNYLHSAALPYLYINADDPQVREQFTNASLARLKQIVGSNKLLAIDEAQRIENIGITAKLIIDHLKDVQVIISGSSALELANTINEPLTGRKWEYFLFPISWAELSQHIGVLAAGSQIEQRLLFGMYPDVINHPGDERTILNSLTDSYLYKDILALHSIRKPDLLPKLLKALALQVGQEVSYNELSRLLEADKKTVMSYLDLLEKAFVIFRLNPLSRNVRNEINSTRKIYFLDNGIRNAIIANFSPLSQRTDTGALWENFLVSERRKKLHYEELFRNTYFWRTHTQQEIDYVEEYDGKLLAYEFKWSANAKVKFPKTFMDAYPNTKTQIITKSNFEEFLALTQA